MTAIFALWHHGGKRAREDGARMLDALRPHGIDHQVHWDEGPLALGRTLYRTLPEDAYDCQPVVLCGGKQRLVADVRLDNRAELESALGLTPQECAVSADSAILGRAWERWGPDCVSHLIGEFAFIVWDRSSRRLTAVRDHVGQRALVYHAAKDFIAVASMPKGLLCLPSVPRAVDREKLALSVAGALLRVDHPVYDTRTHYQGISSLPPRHTLTATAAAVTLERYWEIESRATLRLSRDEDYVLQAREIFDTAVRSRLRGVGAIGSELSSGLDSTTVTVTAARQLAARGESLTAFTAVPRNGAAAVAPWGRMADEGPAAASVASGLANVEHVSLPYPLCSPLPLLDSMIDSMDRPVSTLCYLPISEQIGRQARARGIKILLSGGAGNLTLSYAGSERLPLLLAQGRWMEWAAEVFALAKSRHRRLGQSAAGLVEFALPAAWHRLLGRRFIHPLAADKPALRSRYLEPYTALGVNAAVRVNRDDRRQPSSLWARRLATLTAGGGEALVHAGLLARHGVEYRTPAKDKRLIDFCMALPLEQVYRHGRARLIVRRMMRDELPPGVLAQRRRGSQAAGWLDNLRAGEDDVRALLRSMRHSETGTTMFDLDRLDRLAETIPKRGEDDPTITADYRRVLSFALAAAQFIRHVEVGGG